MAYRTYHITHSKEGFKLEFAERSGFRDFMVTVADKACVLTGHRFCNSAFGAVAEWADKKERVLLEMPTDRETIRPLQWRPDDWAYLDEEDDDEHEERA